MALHCISKPQLRWSIISDETVLFTSLLQTFITLMKPNDYSIEDVRRQNAHTSNESTAAQPAVCRTGRAIYEGYQQGRLASRTGFSATSSTGLPSTSNQWYRQPFDYIIVKVSGYFPKVVPLIQALKDQNPHCKLFCVGDDCDLSFLPVVTCLLFKYFPTLLWSYRQVKIETVSVSRE
jgi:DNA helicase-4